MSTNRRAEFLGRKEKREKGKGVAVAGKSVIFTKDDKQRFELLPGKMRGKEVGTLLGKGAFGRVKQALDDKGNAVAVKVSEGTIGFYEAHNELKMLTIIGDRNPELALVCYVEKFFCGLFSTTCYKTYLFQTLIKGKALGTFLQDSLREKVEKAERYDSLLLDMIKILLKVFDALDEIHKKGVTHEDLHANNILWDAGSGTPTIIDFGHATHKRQHEKQSSSTFEQLKLQDFQRICNSMIHVVDEQVMKKSNPTDSGFGAQFVKKMRELSRGFWDVMMDSSKTMLADKVIEQSKKELNILMTEIQSQIDKGFPAPVTPPKVSISRMIVDFLKSICRGIASLFCSADVSTGTSSYGEAEEKSTSSSTTKFVMTQTVKDQALNALIQVTHAQKSQLPDQPKVTPQIVASIDEQKPSTPDGLSSKQYTQQVSPCPPIAALSF